MGPIEITLSPGFSVGSLAISWYGVAIFAAVVIVVGLGIFEGRRLGIPPPSSAQRAEDSLQRIGPGRGFPCRELSTSRGNP